MPGTVEWQTSLFEKIDLLWRSYNTVFYDSWFQTIVILLLDFSFLNYLNFEIDYCQTSQVSTYGSELLIAL